MSTYNTYLSIDLDALVFNFNFFKSKLAAKTKFMAVVKAFAYGHDAIAVAQKLEEEGVDYFAIAYINEGISLRKAGIKTPIVLLHPQENDVANCVKHQIEPNIYSFRILEAFSKVIQETNVSNFGIHLKFNTGLNRLGFTIDDIPELIVKLEKNKYKVVSVFSHLVASEDHKERDFTLGQIDEYRLLTKQLETRLSYTFIKHLTNTSGTLNYPEAHFDMVRIGIGLYGYANELALTRQLKNVASLYSVISQIHKIKKGESVGYNRSYKASKKTISATIPIGHADGIPRTWGNGVGYVSINGIKANVLGNVCMDMIMVDVTDIICSEGDQVVIFDNQANLIALAKQTGTISYEVLTAISQRVARVLKKRT